MKKAKTLVILAAAGVISSLAVVGTLHASPDKSGHNQDCKHHSMGKHHEGRLNFLSKKLDLNDEQKKIVADMRANDKALIDQHTARLKSIKSELAAIGFGENFNKEKVQSLIVEKSQIKSQLAMLKIESMNELYNTLTPEQQVKMIEMKNKRMARMH